MNLLLELTFVFSGIILASLLPMSHILRVIVINLLLIVVIINLYQRFNKKKEANQVTPIAKYQEGGHS